MNNHLLNAALSYASQGYRVIPLHWTQDGECNCKKDNCASKGKHPLTRNGLKDASDDSETIKSWWHKYPKANIGLATGSGIMVIDVDVKKGAKGLESIQTLEKVYGRLPKTRKANTPSGGYHLFFQTLDEWRNKVNILPGIDIRAEGGYVVVAPSVIDGKAYEWEDKKIELAYLPEKFLSVLQKKQVQKISNDSLPFSLKEGERNEGIFKLACRYRSKGLRYEEAEILILQAADSCVPPLEHEEAIRCLTSAYKYEPGSTQYPLSEIGNAERFVSQHGVIIRFVPEINRWLVCENGFWFPSEHGEVERLVKQTIRSIK